MELALNINPDSSVPLHEQVVSAIEQCIATGRLKPGQIVPSTRELAQSLVISRGTVIRAYKELIDRGLLQARKGSGTVIALANEDRSFIFKTAQRSEAANVVNEGAVPISDYRYSHVGRLLNSIANLEISGAEDISKAAPPRNLLPVRRWRELIAKHSQLRKPDEEADEHGSFVLREAVCQFLATTRGMQCTREQVSVFSNTDQALDTLSRLVLDPGDFVAVENPGYPGARKAFIANGANVIPVPVDEDGLIVEQLLSMPERPKMLYATPSGQDPTGVIMQESRQHALIEWARRNGCWIIEDGWDTDFWHGRPATTCMQNKGPDQIVYLYSFWKILFPLSTASFLVVPQSMAPHLRRFRSTINRADSSLELTVLAALINEGEVAAVMQRLKKTYRKRRQLLIYTLSTVLGSLVKIYPTHSGTHILVQFKTDRLPNAVLAAASDCGLHLVDMNCYYGNKLNTNQFLMSFSNLSMTLLSGQITKFKEFL